MSRCSFLSQVASYWGWTPSFCVSCFPFCKKKKKNSLCIFSSPICFSRSFIFFFFSRFLEGMGDRPQWCIQARAFPGGRARRTKLRKKMRKATGKMKENIREWGNLRECSFLVHPGLRIWLRPWSDQWQRHFHLWLMCDISSSSNLGWGPTVTKPYLY